jgi:hypothetical protein
VAVKLIGQKDLNVAPAQWEQITAVGILGQQADGLQVVEIVFGLRFLALRLRANERRRRIAP